MLDHDSASKIETVNIASKFDLFKDHWSPKIVGELNGQSVKLARLQGEFVLHEHANEDELFLVIDGHLKIELDDETLEIGPGEFVIIPRGVKHKPIAEKEVKVLLFEPSTTVNTGGEVSELTQSRLDRI